MFVTDNIMKEFYDWFFLETGRSGDALFSWPHLLSVTLTLALFLGAAVLLGKKFKGNKKAEFIILLVAGISTLLTQTAKMIYLCWGQRSYLGIINWKCSTISM